jgi:hypothetical protein
MADARPPVMVADVQLQASVATPRPAATVADRHMAADRTAVVVGTAVVAGTVAAADMGGNYAGVCFQRSKAA